MKDGKKNTQKIKIMKKLTELTKTEQKSIAGGGKIAEWIGYYGTKFLYHYLGYDNAERDGDYRVKAVAPW